MEITFIERLNKVPDYRKGNAIRHKLVDIRVIALLTFICNGNGYAAMRIFGKITRMNSKKFWNFLMGFLRRTHLSMCFPS